MEKKYDANPYSSLYDPYSAVEEYYKLKRMLERNDDNLTLADFVDEDIDIENFNFDELREKLNEIKLKKRYSFTVMARLIGVSDITLSNFIRGKRNILKDNIPKFLRFVKGEPAVTGNNKSKRILPKGITADSTFEQLVEGIRFYKEQNNLKGEDLAAELGIKRVNIWRLLNGKSKRLRVNTRQKLIEVLGG